MLFKLLYFHERRMGQSFHRITFMNAEERVENNAIERDANFEALEMTWKSGLWHI